MVQRLNIKMYLRFNLGQLSFKRW